MNRNLAAQSPLPSVSEETGRKLRNMSLFCAVLVVCIHVDWPCDVPLSVSWFVSEAVREGVARIAVPFFFVASGFLLARHFDEVGWWRREVLKRVVSLLVPFLCWSLISFVLRPEGSWIQVLGLDLTSFPSLVPLWYVRCLFLFTLAAGVFRFLVTRFRAAWLACAFVAWVLSLGIADERVHGFFARGFSLSGAFFFSLGIYIRRFDVAWGSRRTAALSLVVGLSLLAAKLVAECTGFGHSTVFRHMSLPFLLYSAWVFMPAAKLPTWLVSCAFPMFLMHSDVSAYARRILSCAVEGEFAKSLSVFCLTVAASIGLALLLRRIAPRLAGVLFGGR